MARAPAWRRQPSPPNKKGAGFLLASVANLTKNMVGAGILSLPAALLRGSTIPGCLALVAVGFLCASSFVFIAYLCHGLGCETYHDLGLVAFGPRVANTLDVIIVFNCFLVCVAYVILIGDFLEKSGQGLFDWFGPRQLPMWGCTLLFMLPLSHARNLSPLRYTSMVGLAIIVLVWCYVVGDCLRQPSVAAEHLTADAFRLDLGIFSMIAISTNSFNAHYNAPRFFEELDADLQAHTRMVVYAFGLTTFIYLGFALAGAGIFGNQVLGDLLKNYPSDGHPEIFVIWLGWALSSAFTFPLVFSAGRDSLMRVTPLLRRLSREHRTATHVAVTTFLVIAITAFACCVDDVSLVTGLSGANTGSVLCWVFPAAVYMNVARGPDDYDVPATPHTARLLGKGATVSGSAAMMGYSMFIMFFGTLSAFVGVLHALGVL